MLSLLIMLSLLLIIIVLEVLSNEIRSGYLKERLYDLALVSESLESHEGRLEAWKGMLESKGLRVNVKTKAMINRGSSIYCVRKIFRKTNIFYPPTRIRMCTYQGLRNVSFSENFECVVNRLSLVKILERV